MWRSEGSPEPPPAGICVCGGVPTMRRGLFFISTSWEPVACRCLECVCWVVKGDNIDGDTFTVHTEIQAEVAEVSRSSISLQTLLRERQTGLSAQIKGDRYKECLFFRMLYTSTSSLGSFGYRDVIKCSALGKSQTGKVGNRIFAWACPSPSLWSCVIGGSPCDRFYSKCHRTCRHRERTYEPPHSEWERTTTNDRKWEGYFITITFDL